VTQTKIGNLFSGKDPFSDLGFYVPAGQNKYLEIYADVTILPTVAMASARLQDVGTAQPASMRLAFPRDLDQQPTISNSNSINTMTVVGKSVAKVEVSQSQDTLGSWV